MSLSVTCQCGRNIRAASHLRGRKVYCPACRAVVHVQVSSAPAPSAAVPAVGEMATLVATPIHGTAAQPVLDSEATNHAELASRSSATQGSRASDWWQTSWPLVVGRLGALRRDLHRGLVATVNGTRWLHWIIAKHLDSRLSPPWKPHAELLATLALMLTAVGGLWGGSGLFGSRSVASPAEGVMADAAVGDAVASGEWGQEVPLKLLKRLEEQSDGQSEPTTMARSETAGGSQVADWWDEEPVAPDPREVQVRAALGLLALFAGADLESDSGYSGHDTYDSDLAEQRRRQAEAEYESRRSSAGESGGSMFQSSPVWDGAFAPSPGWNEASPVWQGAYSPSW